MPREDRVLERGDDGLLVAEDAGEDVLARLQLRDEVVADLVLDGLGRVSGRDELSEGGGAIGHETPLPQAYGISAPGDCGLTGPVSVRFGPVNPTGSRARGRPAARRELLASVPRAGEARTEGFHLCFRPAREDFFEEPGGRDQDEVGDRFHPEGVRGREARLRIQDQIERGLPKLLEEIFAFGGSVLRDTYDLRGRPSVGRVQALEVGPRQPARRAGGLEEREEERKAVRLREEALRRDRPASGAREGGGRSGDSGSERCGRDHARV